MISTFRPEEHRVPIASHKDTIHVLVDVLGTWREVFWMKYTKKGDLLTSTGVVTTRLSRGIARIAGAALEFEEEPVEVASGERLHQRRHFTIHPSVGGDPEKASAVVNGHGGCQTVGLDFRTVKQTEAVMVHRMTDPALYPAAGTDKCELRFSNIFREDAYPEFHVFVTPLVGQMPADEPVPFLEGSSANFVAEPAGLSKRHLLFQVRLGYQPSATFPAEHAFLIPRN